MDTTCDQVRALAERFVPVLRFGSTERFFPVSAESWLGHFNDLAWRDGGGLAGTAVLQNTPEALPDDPSAVDAVRRLVRGGSAGNGQRIALATDPADPNAIGNPAYGDDFFLDVGGWGVDAGNINFRYGNRAYLRGLYASLAQRLNPDDPGAPFPAGAAFLTPPPAGPVIHASVEWAGAFARIDRADAERGRPMLPLGPFANDATFDRYLTVTYSFLYPVLEDRFASATGGPALLPREGQWEAITLVFRADSVDTVPPSRFEFANNNPTPLAVAFSKGYSDTGQPSEKPVFDVRLWSTQPPALADDTHVVSFVSIGTHKNLFAPTLGTPAFTTTLPPAHPVSDWIVNDFMSVYGPVGLIVAQFFWAGGPIVGVIANIVFIVIGLLMYLIAGIAYLFELAFPREERHAEAPPSPVGVERDNASADGAAVVPAGVTTPGSGHGTFGVAGRDPTASSDVAAEPLTVANLLHPAEVGPCAPPAWRGFGGRWGVAPLTPATAWAPGTRYLPADGRSHAYWALARTLEVLVNMRMMP